LYYRNEYVVKLRQEEAKHKNITGLNLVEVKRTVVQLVYLQLHVAQNEKNMAWLPIQTPRLAVILYMIDRTVCVTLYTVFHCLSPLVRKYVNMYILQRPRHWTQDKTVLFLEQTTEGPFACNQQTHYLIRTDREPKGEAVVAKNVRSKVTRTKLICRSFLNT
jgi:hypothetical protein